MRHKGWEGTIGPRKNAKGVVHTGMTSRGVDMCVCICGTVMSVYVVHTGAMWIISLLEYV